jgi:hypothetical protein
VEFLALGDSGASCTTMSRGMAEACGLKWYSKSVNLQMAVSDQQVTTLGTAMTNLCILTAKPIWIKRAPIWIVDHPMNEVLIGEDVLLKLNIDVHGLLEKQGGITLEYETGELISEYPLYGGESEKVLITELMKSIETAKAKGLPEDNIEKWKNLLLQHVNEFRMTLSFDRQADLPEMEVHFNKEKAVKVRPIRISYTLEQEKFMDYYADKLIRHGYAYENPNARYVSEALIIAKVPQPTVLEEDYRLVVNLKRANAACEPHYWPLPTFEDIQRHLYGAKYFITLDLKNGYWQVGLHPESRELFSFSTHRQVITPCRIPQGSTDAVMYFTYLMMKTFDEKLFKGLVPWLDDLLLYSDTCDRLYELLAWVLKKAAKVGLKFSPKKLVLFASEIKWCGKIITPQGVQVDPSRIKALVEMNIPTKVDQLMQFVHASNWIRTSIMDYAKIFAPLYEKLNDALGDGKRTSKRARKINMDLLHDSVFKEHYRKAKEAIIKSVCLSHPNMDWVFILMTDASDFAWGAVLFQLEIFDDAKLLKDQDLQPLSMLSGCFKAAQLNWSTPEKEAYAIVESVERLRYLLLRPNGFIILTDHKNLVFNYDPNSFKRLNVRARLDRWILRLRGYRYEIKHIAGQENLWSDLLSRWGAPDLPDIRPDSLCSVRRQRNIARHVATPVVEPLKEFLFPTKRKLREWQQQAQDLPRSELKENLDGLFVNQKNQIWIPTEARMSMLTIAHYGLAGHKSVKDTFRTLQEKVFWPNLKEEVDLFVLDCILCRCAKMVYPTRVHLGIQQRPTKPNKVIHFDYFYVTESTRAAPYLLVIRDGFSRFVMIFPCEKADSERAVRCILEWIGIFGVPEKFFSDNGPHFRNTVMRELARRLNTVHDFSTVYCAWANGLIERVLRDIKALIKIFLHELKMDRDKWPQLCVNILMALNHRPSDSLGGRTPVEVHTGLAPHNPLAFYFSDQMEYQELKWTPDIEEHVAGLSRTLDKIHEAVYKATERITKISRKNEVKLPELEIGDYVLYCFCDRAPQNDSSKLNFKWIGPFQIVDTKSDYVFYIKDLISHKILEAHIDRLSFYSTDQLNVDVALMDLISREGLAYEISEFLDIVWDEDTKRFLVKTAWTGFSKVEATFEPFASILKQVPLLLLNFLNCLYRQGNKTKVKKIFAKEKKLIMGAISNHGYDIETFDFIR